MFLQVRPIQGYRQSLTYALPATWKIMPQIGDLVTVPLRQQTVLATVEKISTTDTTWLDQHGQPLKIRPALHYELALNHPEYKIFLQNLSRYYQLPVSYLLKRFWGALTTIATTPVIDSHSISMRPLTNIAVHHSATLTAEQQQVFAQLVTQLTPATRRFQANLIHGVTGSGKTEIYAKLIQANWELGYSTLFLLPEVALATNFAHLLPPKLTPEIPIFSFHSGSTRSHKQALWAQLRQNRPLLVIGVHLPVLLPITNLGLILIDEEHDPGFQEKSHPQLNTKECALMRAQLSQIPIVLGSATPAISTLYQLSKPNWRSFQLHQRYQGNFPQIQVVNLRTSQQRQRTKQFWFSRELLVALQERLNRREQTIIFLNRRGYSFFIQCHNCGFIPNCPNCAVSLTLHSDQTLHCHYCNTTQNYPITCPECQGAGQKFLKKGLGTQQVVALLSELFPTAKIARADLDITRQKKLWPQIVADFSANKIDILVGTQTITKGYHFPHVTLVGVLWADLNLHFPIYNAAETTLQQLLQVAGRACRQSPQSTVIVQTLTEHPIFNYLNELDYLKFYELELTKRAEHRYPPLARLAEIEIKHSSEQQVIKDALSLSAKLQQFAQQFAPLDLARPAQSQQLEPAVSAPVKHDHQTQSVPAAAPVQLSPNDFLQILGPAKPPVAKIKNWHFRKIYLKSNRRELIIQAWQYLQREPVTSSIFFTPNPLQ